MDLSLFVLISLVVVNCYNNIKNDKLDLSLKSDNVGVKYYEREFDNVFYSYFKPKNGTIIRSVYFQNDIIWNPLDPNEYVRYALLANNDNTPSLLYLLLVGSDGITDQYYQKYGYNWKKINKFHYDLYIQRIKDTVTNRYVSMFLSTADCSPYYNIYDFSGKTQYTFISLKSGLFCFNVYYKGRIWISPNKKSRCVAAWAYKVNSNDYNLVRLLVTHSNNTSELLTFKYNQRREKKWQEYKEEFKFEKSMPNLKYAENLIHPEYEFVDKRSELYFPIYQNKYIYEKVIYNDDPQILYIDPYVINNHTRTIHESLDDVIYYHYTPLSLNMVTKIYFSNQKIWESYLGETLKNVLVVHNDSGPVMAYLLLKNGNKLNSMFLRKKKNIWSRTDFEYYKTMIKVLSSETKIFNYHKLDLYKSFNSKFYDVTFSGEYVFYPPRLGHRISSLYYRGQKLWDNSNHEKCVAVFAYHGGNYYLLKVLVTNDKKSDIILYYRIDDKFVKLDSIDVRKTDDNKKEYFYKYNKKSFKMDEKHAKLALNPPCDFNYPHYDFTPKYEEIDFTQPLDKYELLFDLNKVYNEPFQKNYMKDFLTPIYPQKDCVYLDVANFDKTVATFNTGVFDGVLQVGYFEPLPGKYFSDISEKGVKLYSRNLPNEACIGITFYMDKDLFLLADVLLANKRPSSIYLQKFKGIWRYVTKEDFEELLKSYKKPLEN